MSFFKKWAVKRFFRVSSDTVFDPKEIRPPDVLHYTTDYLLGSIADADLLINVKYKYPVDKLVIYI